MRSQPPDDAQSVASQASRRTAGTQASKPPAGANDVIFDLQCRTRDYVAKTGVERLELDEVKLQIKETMKCVARRGSNTESREE